MVDIRIESFNFTACQVTFTAESENGLAYFQELYGPGACDVSVYKSWAGEFIAAAVRAGLQVR